MASVRMLVHRLRHVIFPRISGLMTVKVASAERAIWGHMVKSTFQDIAALAGVGTATVERVLNGRGGVRPDTVEKVVMAARKLDYPRVLPDAHRGLMRIEVLLVRPETSFFRRLSNSFERIAATLSPLVVVQRSFVDEMNPAQIARRIREPGQRRAALILAVPDSHEIREAVDAQADEGLPVSAS